MWCRKTERGIKFCQHELRLEKSSLHKKQTKKNNVCRETGCFVRTECLKRLFLGWKNDLAHIFDVLCSIWICHLRLSAVGEVSERRAAWLDGSEKYLQDKNKQADSVVLFQQTLKWWIITNIFGHASNRRRMYFNNFNCCLTETHLYNVLSVLSSILEHSAAVLQVFFIQTECLGINLLERWISKLRLLQVHQEVGVDWTALDQTHAAE